MKWYNTYYSFLDNIKRTWININYVIRKNIRWVIKSYQYAIFLREDFDFDHSQIFRLLQFKLKRTRECILKNNIIIAVDLVAAEIKHAEDLIENHLENDFCKELWKEHKKKWGSFERIAKDNDTFSSTAVLPWRRQGVTNDTLAKQESAETFELYNLENKRETENLNMLFDHIKNNYQKWWD